MLTIQRSPTLIPQYVDDTKVSHVDPAVATSIIETLEQHFDKMTDTGEENTHS
jgi:hypothetical protein